jgi:hypothetical protein
MDESAARQVALYRATVNRPVARPASPSAVLTLSGATVGGVLAFGAPIVWTLMWAVSVTLDGGDPSYAFGFLGLAGIFGLVGAVAWAALGAAAGALAGLVFRVLASGRGFGTAVASSATVAAAVVGVLTGFALGLALDLGFSAAIGSGTAAAVISAGMTVLACCVWLRPGNRPDRLEKGR